MIFNMRFLFLKLFNKNYKLLFVFCFNIDNYSKFSSLLFIDL